MRVREVMQTSVVTVSPGVSVQDVARMMRENDVTTIPVVDENGVIIGIIGEEDLIYRLMRPHIPPHIELLGGVIYLENPFELKKEMEKLKSVNAEEIMTRKVYTVEPEANVADVAKVMVEKDINGLPVVENGKLVGMVTRHDLLAAVARKDLTANLPEASEPSRTGERQEKPIKKAPRGKSVEVPENITSEEYYSKDTSSRKLVTEIAISVEPHDLERPRKANSHDLPEISSEFQEAHREAEPPEGTEH